MKNLVCLLVIFSIVFVSCDGRKNHNDLLQEAITNFSQKLEKVETITFYPKEYTEVATDTLISNKVSVHIKNYSLTEETILLAKSDNLINFHRVFESEISINTKDKDILNTTINARNFTNSEDLFWNNATLQQVWVNQELSTVEEINLEISFINPLDQSYKLYRMSVNENGQQQIHLIEEQS